MNKVELAKMLGLSPSYGEVSVSKWEILETLGSTWSTIECSFCNEKFSVVVEQEDFAEDKLAIKESDLVKEGDIKVCIKQVEDLIWERAAEEYLERVHKAAMVLGG